MDRKTILNKLINYEEPLEVLHSELSRHEWDLDKELIELRREHIVNIIQKYLNNEITKDELIGWANAVEMRDDIEYENGHEKLIATTLNELNTPEINNPIKREYLLDIIATLLLRP